jgi:hypothetical protein
MKWLKRIQQIIDMIRRKKPDPKPEPEFPEGTIWMYGPDISSWPVTIPLHSGKITRKAGTYHTAHVDYDHLQTLPKWHQDPDPQNLNQHNVNGTIWVLRKFRGQWIMGSIDYLRVNQRTKDFDAIPAYNIEPMPGERVGLMVSTTSRQWDGTRVDGDPNEPYRERSNVVWTVWP